MNKAPINNNIHNLRVHNGISQEELAESLGIQRTYLSKLENQKFSPGPALMSKVCRYFGKQLGDVFYITEDKPS